MSADDEIPNSHIRQNVGFQSRCVYQFRHVGARWLQHDTRRRALVFS
jgi:hypothetical protein